MLKLLRIKQAITVILLCTFVTYILLLFPAKSILVILSFILNIVFSLWHLIKIDSRPYSLDKIFYLFAFFFFGVAPLIQYSNNVVFWGGSPFGDNDYLYANFLIFISLWLYQFVYHLKLNFKLKIGEVGKFYRYLPYKKELSPHILLIVSFLSALYTFYMVNMDFVALFFRGLFEELAGENNQTMMESLLSNMFLRPLPAFCLLLYRFSNNKKKSFWTELCLWILMLFSNAPTAMPRFAAAAFYLPILFAYCPQLQKPLNFPLLMICAILLIFPFLDQFRGSEITFRLNLDMFQTGHFDSYQMFMRVVSLEYITWGYQLLGVLFFYIPRSMWLTKPIGSGYVIAHDQGFYFDNIAMNYLGEGYMNFGLVGIFLFVVILALFNSFMDGKYWKNERVSPLFCTIFFVMLGMEFAILRGALLNILPVAVGYVVGIYLVYSRPLRDVFLLNS